MAKTKPKQKTKNSAHYPIKLVVRRTGLSGHLIRMWERRYQAVKPVRTDTNRRVYTDTEVRRLEILGKLTRSGHTISAIANLSTEKIEKMLHVDYGAADGTRRELVIAPQRISAESAAADALKCISALDAHGLKQVLVQAEAGLGQSGMLKGIIAPLLEEVGRRVLSGKFRSTNENVATAVCRRYVDSWRGAHTSDKIDRVLLAGTLQGDWHECGPLGTASLAAASGWYAIYLGPSLSIEDIAKAVQTHAPEVLAINISSPVEEKALRAELERLHVVVGKRTRLIVLGDGARQLAEMIRQIDISRVESAEDFVKLVASSGKV